MTSNEVHGSRLRAPIGPCVTVTAFVIAIAAFGIRGADYPAQLLRALAWDRSSGSMWNSYWYGGHPTATYSLLAPSVMAVIGPFALTAISSIVATFCFSRLTTSLVATPSTTIANHAFAVAAAVNVLVGRAPFAFGMALALGALLAWHGERTPLAVVVAFLTALASPVAAVFLAIATTAVVLDQLRQRRSWSAGQRARARQGVAITLATTVPVGIVTLLFHEPGRFPFRVDHFVECVLAACLLAAVVRVPAVRIAAGLSVVASVALFLVPNPLGGNFVRLAQFAAVPLCVTAIHSTRRTLLAPIVVLLLAGVGWTVQPGVVAAVDWWGDPSVDADFHQPVVDEVLARNLDGRPIGRLEVPFTANHWESFFVASEVPFARGWERQLDLVRNEELYDEDLTIDAYHRWLQDNAVRWIAVPDVTLDEGGRAEALLIDREGTARDIDWLRSVWQDDNWHLYEVLDYRPIVEPPAELVRQGPDFVVLRTGRPATVSVRYSYVEELRISGAACIESDEDGWITAHLLAPGVFEIDLEPAASLPGNDPARCA